LHSKHKGLGSTPNIIDDDVMMATGKTAKQTAKMKVTCFLLEIA
jgi:hypothetical protein